MRGAAKRYSVVQARAPCVVWRCRDTNQWKGGTNQWKGGMSFVFREQGNIMWLGGRGAWGDRRGGREEGGHVPEGEVGGQQTQEGGRLKEA